MRLLLQLDEKGDAAIARTAELANLAPHEVRVALRYYAGMDATAVGACRAQADIVA